MLKAILNFIRRLRGIQIPIDYREPVRTSVPMCEFTPKSPVSMRILDTPNKWSHPETRDIKYIIVHSTGGTASSTVSWFLNPLAKASAHYLVDKKGEITTFGSDNDVLWHAGKSSWGNDTNLNSNSIGIELENLNDGKDLYTDIQICVSLKLCLDLSKKYGVDTSNILRHSDIAPGRKVDPVNFPWIMFTNSLDYFFGIQSSPEPTDGVNP